jgi:signal transduction histidine kinase
MDEARHGCCSLARRSLEGDLVEPLHAVLTAHPNEVIVRWTSKVRGTVAPEAVPAIELLDHIPDFLREVVAALRAVDGLPSVPAAPDESPTAAVHGAQRLRLGFSLDSVVREYGALRDAILATGRDHGAAMALHELQVVFDSIITGIASAVSEYARQRDAEIQRQHNEHFAFVAHELRNPLSSATMAFESLLRKKRIDPEEREVAILSRGLSRMREHIDHSLDVARVVSGIELRTERVRLRALLDEAALAAMSQAEEKRIELRVVVAQDEAVHLDLRLVRSALSNLVSNAVKFTAPGGVVELRGSCSGARATIEIEDCCGGLPPGTVETAFAPFVRMNDRESGFGLGLAIAKQAVDAHGGALRVQDLAGKGCVFVLEFPLAGMPSG